MSLPPGTIKRLFAVPPVRMSQRRAARSRCWSISPAASPPEDEAVQIDDDRRNRGRTIPPPCRCPPPSGDVQSGIAIERIVARAAQRAVICPRRPQDCRARAAERFVAACACPAYRQSRASRMFRCWRRRLPASPPGRLRRQGQSLYQLKTPVSAVSPPLHHRAHPHLLPVRRCRHRATDQRFRASSAAGCHHSPGNRGSTMLMVSPARIATSVCAAIKPGVDGACGS